MYRLLRGIAVHIGVRIWLAIALLLPVLAWGQAAGDEAVQMRESAVPANPASEDEAALEANWVDTAHLATAESAQALVEWMDEFFGDPSYDAEKAESFLRLEFENEWDEVKGNDFGVRVRGKVQLPKISQRVELLFNDDDTAAADREEQADSDNISLQLNVRETRRSRFDATLSWSSGAPKPGVRYRNEGELNEKQQQAVDSIREQSRYASGGRHPHQARIGEEPDFPAVGRPERGHRTLGPLDTTRRNRIQPSQIQ